jgi:uncharacterized protein (DUF736 family)
MRIGVVRKIEFEGARYLEAHIHIPFFYPAKFRLFKTKDENASEGAGMDSNDEKGDGERRGLKPNYLLYLIPPHPIKGEKQATHNAGALWLRTNNKGESFMSGYVDSPALPSGRIGLMVFKTKDNGDWLYDIITGAKDERK